MSFLNDLLNDSKVKLILKNVKEIDNLCPKYENIFRAFVLCPVEDVKVVIFGQDPYYLKGVADGLAFSTQQQKTPKSLANIFKEIKIEYKDVVFQTNDLTYWAKQGILLLNSSLTTIENIPNAHVNIGWDYVIKKTINFINNKLEKVIFVLWGNNAKKLEKYINKSKHYVLISSHPSPLSVNKFWNNNHFLTINELLEYHNKKIIDWNLK